MIDRQGESQAIAQGDLAVVLGRLAGDRTHGENGRLGRIDHRLELFDSEHAEVADREGAAGVLVWLQFAGVRALGEIPGFAADLADALLVGVSDHRHDQPSFGRHRDANVNVAVADEAVLGERDVYFGDFADGQGRPFDHEIVEADLRFGLVVDLLSERAELSGVNNSREEKVGHRTGGLSHAARNGAAHLRELDPLIAIRRGHLWSWRRLLFGWFGFALEGRLDVHADHATLRTTARNVREVQPVLGRDMASHGRCSHLAVGWPCALAPLLSISISVSIAWRSRSRLLLRKIG